MYRPTRFPQVLALLYFIVLQAGAAHASLVAFTVWGSVTQDDPGNAFAVAAGDPVSLAGVFDDVALAPTGASEVFFGSGFANYLRLTIGTVTFTESMDGRFAAQTGPSLAFLDGKLMGVDYFADYGSQGALASLFVAAGGWAAEDADSRLADGTLDLDSLRISAVPAPASILLLLPIVLSFAAASRRQLKRRAAASAH